MSGYPTDDGLELVAGEDLGAAYEWDVTEVWVDAIGNYYVYSGSGCSCNLPYEYDYSGIGDLDGPYTAAQVLHEVSYTLKERLIRAGV